MWRIIYSIAIALLLPFVFLRLLWKSRSNPAYKDKLSDRLGLYKLPKERRFIWVHAVSVGEVIAAVPLVKKLILQYPDHQILVTTMTPTGADQVKSLLAGQAFHAYIPYDLPWLINAALNRVRPRVLIIMETEIWPNLIHQTAARKVPVIYVNMRLSEKSYKGYNKAKFLFKPILKKITAVAAQSENDAKRLIALGARPETVKVIGNIKFDAKLPVGALGQGETLRQKLGADRLVWISASTHQGEEEQVFTAHQLILKRYPDALLVIVPRHPQRFESVFELAQRLDLTTLKQSQVDRHGGQNQAYEETQVYLVDSMGQMFMHYCACDIAFVGGSLVNIGGHNILEPWLANKPVIVGANMFNFARITEQALKENAIIMVNNADELADQVMALHQSRQKVSQLNSNAALLLKNNQGALQRSLDLINAYLK